MTHHSGWERIVPESSQPRGLLETVLAQMGPQPQRCGGKQRGRPAHIGRAHLGWAILWCVLQGWQAQLDLWRQLTTEWLGGFAPVAVCDQAVYNQLARHGLAALRLVFEQVATCLQERLAPLEQWQLASFASAVVALDESTLDQVGRWLSGLRDIPVGDPRLLAGRLSCLFDVRRQQWLRVDVLPEASAGCLLHARELLTSLLPQTLLLFDLGYFSFAWLDELTRRGFYWVGRLRERSSYRVEHIFVQQDGYLDALIFLGAYRADRTRFALRLIQIRHGQQLHRYLTNVLDPRLLSGAEVVRLYQRRWDIELAFRALKDHLHVNVLWSAKWEVLQVQLVATLILAQVFHGLQVELAAQHHVEVFDVSLEVLIRLVPRKLLAGQSPTQFVAEYGRRIGLIRPHSRQVYDLPEVAEQDLVWPPPTIQLVRNPRYAYKAAGNANRKRPSPS